MEKEKGFKFKPGYLVTLFLVLLYFLYNNYTETKEKELRYEKQQEIVEKHNLNLETKVIEEKKEIFEIQETTKKVETKKPKEEFVNNKDYGKSEAELDGDIPSIPYTGTLPDSPDPEINDSTILGIDSNNNGVRDDVEIEIVDRFGDDKDLVESFFASNRSSNYAYYLAENNLLTEDKIQEVMNNVHYEVGCSSLYFDNSKYNDESESFYNVSIEIDSEGYNTPSRMKLEKKIAGRFSGQAKVSEITEKTCKDFFERTKLFEVYR